MQSVLLLECFACILRTRLPDHNLVHHPHIPAIDLRDGYETYWSYIPHFVHSPFYVYAYAFGDCLVNSLYGLYQDAHPGFVTKYFEMLKAGGSKHHSELLRPFGLVASKPEFWQKGLQVIERMIDELETMERAS